MAGRSIVAVVMAAAALIGAGAPAAPDAHRWKAYLNARFDYAMCFPADLLTPAPEAPNGYGRRFVARDGAALLVFGRNNVDRLSTATLAGQAGTRLGAASYRVVKPRWFVISGHGATNDYYVKSLIDAEQIKSFELTYPPGDAATWRPIIAQFNACFHSTPHR